MFLRDEARDTARERIEIRRFARRRAVEPIERYRVHGHALREYGRDAVPDVRAGASPGMRITALGPLPVLHTVALSTCNVLCARAGLMGVLMQTIALAIAALTRRFIRLLLGVDEDVFDALREEARDFVS
ncbi:MAG: hypothetical protein NVSMB64_15610 [Candidatus Velthaea sp.]